MNELFVVLLLASVDLSSSAQWNHPALTFRGKPELNDDVEPPPIFTGRGAAAWPKPVDDASLQAADAPWLGQSAAQLRFDDVPWLKPKARWWAKPSGPPSEDLKAPAEWLALAVKEMRAN